MSPKSKKNSHNHRLGQVWQKIKSRSCLRQVGLAIGSLILFGLLIFGWLKIYTRHGQKLSLPDYTSSYLSQAKLDANKNHFEIVVTDSIHFVGKEGGIIISQNPPPDAKVKKDRKVYVTITKYNPDLLSVKDLPKPLYGNMYASAKPMLDALELNYKVKGYLFDPGPEDVILEVYYNDKLIINREKELISQNIEKGGTLEFVLSKARDGITEIPDLRCKKYNAAVFLADGFRLNLKVENRDEVIGQTGDAYVYRQIPPYDPVSTGNMVMGDTIKVYLQLNLPEDCQ